MACLTQHRGKLMWFMTYASGSNIAASGSRTSHFMKTSHLCPPLPVTTAAAGLTAEQCSPIPFFPHSSHVCTEPRGGITLQHSNLEQAVWKWHMMTSCSPCLQVWLFWSAINTFAFWLGRTSCSNQFFSSIMWPLVSVLLLFLLVFALTI